MAELAWVVVFVAVLALLVHPRLLGAPPVDEDGEDERVEFQQW